VFFDPEKDECVSPIRDVGDTVAILVNGEVAAITKHNAVAGLAF